MSDFDALAANLADRIQQEAKSRGRKLSPHKAFYVYVLMDPSKVGPWTYTLPGEKSVTFPYLPFYVGKGTGRRLHTHVKEARAVTGKLDHKQNVIRSLENRGLAVIEKRISAFSTDALALAKEILLIQAIGRADKYRGPLTNKTDGGDGASGAVRSDDFRKNIRLNNLEMWRLRSDEEAAALLNCLWHGRANWWETLSEEGSAQYRSKLVSGFRTYWNSLTQEAREAFSKGQSESFMSWWTKLDRSKQADYVQNMVTGRRNWLNALPDSERGAFANRVRAGMLRYIDLLPESERSLLGRNLMSWRKSLSADETLGLVAKQQQGRVENLASMSPEELREYKSRHRSNIKKTLAGRSAAEKATHLCNLKAAINASPNLVCPHCTLEGRPNNMKRYHFDNCKQNPGFGNY